MIGVFDSDSPDNEPQDMLAENSESFDVGQKPNGRRRFACVFGVLIGLLLMVYLAGSFFFATHFLPGTTLSQRDISLKTPSEVGALIEADLTSYEVTVSGHGFSTKISAARAGVRLDADRTAANMLATTSFWLWPVNIWQERDVAGELAASYSASSLNAVVRGAVDAFNETAELPVDACVVFDEPSELFVVQPEKLGTALDASEVTKSVAQAVASLQPTVMLTAEHLQTPALLATDAHLKSAAHEANALIKVHLQLTLGGTEAGVVSPALVASWVRFGDDLTATLDEGALTSWVHDLATACTTTGAQHTYTRPDGKVISVSGGPYGWSVDEELLLALVKEGVAKGSAGLFEIPCKTTGTAFNGPGAQDWGARYCDIDLSEQYVRFYDDAGALVWESACITGTPNGVHNTPAGVYWLNQKQSPSELKGTNLDGTKYTSTVQYWMPFVGNVIGLHDADWQTSGFGGDLYRQGLGSHGCVNLPPYQAAALYSLIQAGDVVVCHW